MVEGLVFGIVFVAFFVLRAVAATVFFLALLPEDDRCINCDEPTVRIRSVGWNALLPGFRTSWCPVCGWEGLLRTPKKPSSPPQRAEATLASRH
jgi:hypothetical protein